MFSAKKKPDRKPRRQGPKLPSLEAIEGLRPRLSIRVWLTVLFVLVTAVSAVAAYGIVRPILETSLSRASDATFRQVAEQWDAQIRRDDNPSTQDMEDFAETRNLQWGIVRVDEERGVLRLRGDTDLELLYGVVENSVEAREPKWNTVSVQNGPYAGQRQATYAVPIRDVRDAEGREVENTAIVFNRFYTEGDIENAEKVLNRIEGLALLAGGLALLIAGFAGYFAAVLISRRVDRLNVAAESLAAGNFDERINTHVGDELGSLASSFNAMAASMKDAFGQIEQEKERGNAILDGMTDAVVGVNRDLELVFRNPRAKELLESTPHEFHVRLQEVLAKTRYSGPVTEPEAEAGDRVIEVRAAPLEDGALAILRDVTAERRVQRAKADFIANASHELKTPIFALSGWLEMMEDVEDPELRAEFLNDMRAQTERLKGLAQTLLDLSRLDANATVFRSEEVDLEDLLHSLRRDFGFTGRPINIRTEENVPPVEADPNQLHRALTILVDNAIKYSEDGSPVDLELSRENGHAVISVADRGCGIPEGEIPHIFDRFYRVQGSSRADGTGLGLALAHEITDHLGGRIRVESQPEAGSTFSVLLPMTETARSPNEPQPLDVS
ncbi:MAG: HAMP domain-containing protein [Rubrobacter sp.]|jgi:signal transduction histidine kinase|nr:HAMP domain-containing protein [Rubrobacter sp.]MDQ3316773.1 cell wall metabolism sensor histidine kinase WalK [Actinomycetota bacterium]MDQ3428733.1 cell wall metabolism sensor histidine kinase WalK [Actinomycetota bacterium]